MKLETKLAGLSIYPLLLNLCFLFVIMITTWLSTMLFLGHGMVLWTHNIVASIGCMLILNLFLMFGMLKYLAYNLKNMSFEKTRAHLLHMRAKQHDERPLENHSKLSRPRKKVAKSPTKSKKI
ncbi:MAG: hypothetical protein NXI01_00960 [Gammaproteobacteria bacterium]|nr:hypothetical protein [Gammaproteobacteria bacterium]